MLSSSFAMPRKGHFTAVFKILAYLKSYNRSRFVFDDNYAVINNQFKENVDWTEFYGNNKNRFLQMHRKLVIRLLRFQPLLMLTMQETALLVVLKQMF
jgi:hypothetical protein